jgi:hypothetical protein
MKNIEIFHPTRYLPFTIYLTVVYNTLIKNNMNVNIIDNINNHNPSTKCLIMFMNYFEYINNIDLENKKIIFINADFFLSHSKKDQESLKDCFKKNKENIYVWEYSPLNFKYYDEFNINITKSIFIPLEYSPLLEEIYNTNNIDYDKKPIDILFVGNPNERRLNILKKLQKKYKVEIHTFITDITEYCNVIKKSKIILNIYSTEMNMPFDYYRLSLLYSNKIFVITEKPSYIDSNYQENILTLQENIIMAKYDYIETTVDYYMKQNVKTIEEITRQTYINFKKTNTESKIIKFFDDNHLNT